ncbi:MAG: hypothetical protein HYS13_09655 [Planctomycetia bacterium]|nr:hypothetical protein [Planctomycetia bacterium]
MVREFLAQLLHVRVFVSRQQPDNPIQVQCVMPSVVFVGVVHPIAECHDLHQEVRECLRHMDNGLVRFSRWQRARQGNLDHLLLNPQRFFDFACMEFYAGAWSDSAIIFFDAGAKFPKRAGEQIDLNHASAPLLRELRVFCRWDDCVSQVIERFSNTSHFLRICNQLRTKKQIYVFRRAGAREVAKRKPRANRRTLLQMKLLQIQPQPAADA